MRFLAVLYFCVCIPAFGHCQVVLSSGDYPATLTGVDTLHVTTAASLFPAFSTATPGMWDMTLITDSVDFDIRNRIATAAYQFDDSVEDFLGSFPVEKRLRYQVSSTSLAITSSSQQYSETSLLPMTGGPTDTLFVLGGSSAITPPNIVFTLPCSNGISWNTTSNSDIMFELSYSTFFYLHEPGYLRTYTNKSNVVTNWGKMRVRDMSGAPSPYIDVLQVQTTTITTDSAFLSGGPMPGHIQLLLGITQGKSDTVYSQSYYRKGEVTPLAYVEFTDATFSHAIRAKTHVQRLTNAASDPRSLGSVHLYPNPASDVIEVVAGSEGFTQYVITDIAGRAVQSGHLRQSTRQQIALNASLANGLYQLHLSGRSGQTSTTVFQVQRAQ